MSGSTELPNVFLQQGQLFFDPKPHLVTTVLGSCVSVCLWDTQRGYGGMTHSVLPVPLPGDVPSPRHTEIAVAHLVQAMMAQGSRTGDLRAKLFGGASMLPVTRADLAVGAANVRVAVETLRRHRIPVVVQEVQGTSGRVIRMDTGAGEVWMRRIESNDAA
jgi:chemotaxis protein CheD